MFSETKLFQSNYKCTWLLIYNHASAGFFSVFSSTHVSCGSAYFYQLIEHLQAFVFDKILDPKKNYFFKTLFKTAESFLSDLFRKKTREHSRLHYMCTEH